MSVYNFDKKIVSIIIPCYNDAEYIEQAINSALNQTFEEKEIIVVDDGSNTETKAVLKRLEPKITKLITQENKGQSTARNVGIKVANGEYILVLDSDDYFEPTFCEKAISGFMKDENIKLVTCQANLIYSDGSVEVYIPKGGSISNFKYCNDALGTSIFKKEDWKIVGGYDENMRQGFEDWEFFIRLLKKGGEVLVLNEPLYNYRKRNNSTTSKANSIKYELQKYIFLKHKDIYIDDFENYTSKLLDISKTQEKNKFKILKSLDYKLGNLILQPMRYIKSLFK